MDSPKIYNLPRMILCEGPDDVAFFSNLISIRELPRFHIEHTGRTKSERGGNGKFGAKLEALAGNRSFRGSVKEVVIFSDSDQDHLHSFRNICRQLSSRGLEVPTAPLQKTAASPSISIFMIPHGEPGNLESQCVASARSANAHREHVDHFVALVTSDNWSPSARGKLWLRAAIAAGWQKDPFIQLGEIFDHPTARALIPLDHNTFNGIVAYLRSFAP